MRVERTSTTNGLLEIRHVPGDTGPAYDALYGSGEFHNLRRHHRWLLQALDARPGQRLLDVACGEAGLLATALAWGLDVRGIDLSRVALGRGRHGLPASALAAANGEALPFPDNHFDRVLNVGSLEHYQDPLRGAAEMARVLAPDGLAAILLPNTYGLRWNVLYAWRTGEVYDDGQPLQRLGTRGQWTRLLSAGGFRVEKVLGYESQGDLPARLADLPAFARHPSRWLLPFAAWLPVDMASMQVFLCRKAEV